MKKIITLKSSKSKSLSGIIDIPGDKSISHRALIFTSLCYGCSEIFGLLEADDVMNTLKSLKKLGVKIVKGKRHYTVFGNGGSFEEPKSALNFGNSGTGVRLFSGLLASKNISATLIGDKSLSKRPMYRIIKPLEKLGANIKHNDGFLPLKIDKSNFLHKSTLKEKLGSAQVKSAIILAALDIKGTTTIQEHRTSRNHSEILLKFLGANIKIENEKNYKKISITGPNTMKAKNIFIPGDISSAAFIIVAALLCEGSEIKINSVGINFFRTGILEVLKKMNGNISITKTRKENGEKIADIEIKSSKLKSCKVGHRLTSRLIDEYPILFVAASFAEGVSIFKNLQELKFKESDRLSAMSEALKKCGVEVEESDDQIKIFGKRIQKGGCKINTYNDHRIAMAMLIFGLNAENPVEIDKANMIKTSFPNFYDLLFTIGAQINYV